MEQCFVNALGAEERQGSNQDLERSRPRPREASLQASRELLARAFPGQNTLNRRLPLRPTARATTLVGLGARGRRLGEGGIGFQAQETQQDEG
jgi:hypothetical protein